MTQQKVLDLRGICVEATDDEHVLDAPDDAEVPIGVERSEVAGVDELILALFEEMIRESTEDYRVVVAAQTDPLERLHAFIVRLHEWCDPDERKRGTHNRRPISEFTVQLAVSHADRVTDALAPVSLMLLELLDDAVAAGVIQVDDTRRAAALVQQVVMFSWFGNRIVQNPRLRASSEDIWAFCLHGLRG